MDYDLNSSVIPSQEGRRINLTEGTGIEPRPTHSTDDRKLQFAARRLGLEWKKSGDGVSVRFPDADGEYRFATLSEAIIHQVATGA